VYLFVCMYLLPVPYKTSLILLFYLLNYLPVPYSRYERGFSRNVSVSRSLDTISPTSKTSVMTDRWTFQNWASSGMSSRTGPVLEGGVVCFSHYQMTGDSCRSKSFSPLLQEMAWCQIGTNPFLESLMILDRLQLSKLQLVTYHVLD